MKNVGKKALNWVMGILALVGGIGIGGLFLNGMFLTTAILKWIPYLGHKIVGWLFIITSIIGAVAALIKEAK